MLRKHLFRYFPKRQIILRTNGAVKMLQLSSGHQVAVAVVAVLLLSWFAFSSAGLVVLNAVIDDKETQIGDLADAMQGLDKRRQAARTKLASLSTKLRSKNELLVATVQQKYAVHKQMTELTKQLELAMARTQQKDAHKNKLQFKINKLEEEVRAAVLFSKEIASDAAVVEKSRDSTVQMGLKLSRDRDQAVKEQKRLAGTIGEMQGRIVSLRGEQRDLMRQIGKQTRHNIHALETTIRTAGLDVWTLMERAGGRKSGVGGPFVPGKKSKQDFSGDVEFYSAVAHYQSPDKKMDDRIRYWTRLTEIAEHLPLAAPVESFRLTSRFGGRRDPFRRNYGFHSGLDMVGVYRAVVRAPSSGVVVQAGWKGDYGRTVTIDHGYGITSVYAHLRSVSVKKGDKVTYYQQIGVVGSTGRSTSSHLHYEIRYDGRAINPIRFLKAGKNVLKG